MQQEENKTVDIDTSGPGAEIELENDSKETETPEIETAQKEETKNEVVEEQPQEETKVEAKEEDKKESSKEDELAQYSESVQKRIAKLTKKWREAERQKDEALVYAKSVITEKEKAEQKLSKIEPSFLKTTEDGIKSGLEATKSKLAAAREAGDINAEVEAQSLISEYAYKQAKFVEAKAQQEEYNKRKETEVKTPEINLNRQEAAQGTPDPKAESWASKNTWFGQDTAMTYTAFDLHKKLTEQEGYDPSSDEYYTEIDKRIRLEFPHKFATKDVTETTKPVQTVASAKRSTKSGRKTVRLTPSQVAIAKKLGVPLEEYAKQLNITKEV
jgi:GH15 family glucan-1,4-alpha-glucosidase